MVFDFHGFDCIEVPDETWALCRRRFDQVIENKDKLLGKEGYRLELEGGGFVEKASVYVSAGRLLGEFDAGVVIDPIWRYLKNTSFLDPGLGPRSYDIRLGWAYLHGQFGWHTDFISDMIQGSWNGTSTTLQDPETQEPIQIPKGHFVKVKKDQSFVHRQHYNTENEPERFFIRVVLKEGQG